MFAEHPWNYLLKLFKIIYLVKISFNWQMSENLVAWNRKEHNMEHKVTNMKNLLIASC